MRRPAALAAIAAALLALALAPRAGAQAYPACSALQLAAYKDYAASNGAPCAEADLIQVPSGCATAPAFDPRTGVTPATYARSAFGTCNNKTRTHCGGASGSTQCVHIRAWCTSTVYKTLDFASEVTSAGVAWANKSTLTNCCCRGMTCAVATRGERAAAGAGAEAKAGAEAPRAGGGRAPSRARGLPNRQAAGRGGPSSCALLALPTAHHVAPSIVIPPPPPPGKTLIKVPAAGSAELQTDPWKVYGVASLAAKAGEPGNGSFQAAAKAWVDALTAAKANVTVLAAYRPVSAAAAAAAAASRSARGVLEGPAGPAAAARPRPRSWSGARRPGRPAAPAARVSSPAGAASSMATTLGAPRPAALHALP